MPDTQEYDEAKLKELILYVLHKRPDLSMRDLGAALYLMDATAFVRLGKSITGATYIKAP